MTVRRHAALVLRTAWNAALVLLVAWWAWRIVPKIAAQFEVAARRSEQYSPEAMFAVVWGGFEGIGVLAVIAAAAGSFGTWAWRDVGPIARWTYAGLGLLLLAGAAVSVFRDWLLVGHVFYHQTVLFLVTYATFAFPIVVFGCAYPTLLLRAIRGLRDRRRPAG